MAKDPYKQMMFWMHIYFLIPFYSSGLIVNAVFLDNLLSWFQFNVLFFVWTFFGLIYYADDGKYIG